MHVQHGANGVNLGAVEEKITDEGQLTGRAYRFNIGFKQVKKPSTAPGKVCPVPDGAKKINADNSSMFQPGAAKSPELVNEQYRHQRVEIHVEELVKSFDEKLALDRVTFMVQRGEMVVIVGRSGSGKTTLLRQLTGLERPDRGRVLIADHESPGSPLVDLNSLAPAGKRRLEKHWAMVFQQNALLSGTVYDDIAFPLREVQNMDEHRIRVRVNEVVTAVALDKDKDLNLNVDQLSGGMAKRVAIAAAIAVDPILIFYDEPTTGLDPGLSIQIQDLVRAVHGRHTASGFTRTSIIVTHDKELLRRLRPRIIMLEAGKLVFDGSYEAFTLASSPLIKPYLQEMPVLNARSKL
jgi:phospholipid/cholesterol/gamma-HCH transport system ATP-binding protein